MASIETLRKKFCKDTGLPINIFTEPYFTSRLELFDAKQRYADYINMVSSFNGSETSYLDYYDNISERIIGDIKASAAYNIFQAANMQEYAVCRDIPGKDIYQDRNVGKHYISIDMVKANYTSLAHFELTQSGVKTNDMIFATTDAPYDYGTFIRRYTDKEHIINSKNIRQVIFGKCNPPRQQTYQKYMMDCLLNKLITAGVSESNIASLRSDEIIIALPEETSAKTAMENIAKKITGENEFPVRYETFSLAKIIDQDDRIIGYIKEFENSNTGYELKCVSAHNAAPVKRFLLGQPICDADLVFVNEDRLAKYLTVPELKIVR